MTKQLPKPPELTTEDMERLLKEGQEFAKDIEKRTREMELPTCRCPKCGHVFTDLKYMRI